MTTRRDRIAEHYLVKDAPISSATRAGLLTSIEADYEIYRNTTNSSEHRQQAKKRLEAVRDELKTLHERHSDCPRPIHRLPYPDVGPCSLGTRWQPNDADLVLGFQKQRLIDVEQALVRTRTQWEGLLADAEKELEEQKRVIEALRVKVDASVLLDFTRVAMIRDLQARLGGQ